MISGTNINEPDHAINHVHDLNLKGINTGRQKHTVSGIPPLQQVSDDKSTKRGRAHYNNKRKNNGLRQ